MLKKIFCTAFMAAIILVNAQVSAKDVWVFHDKCADYYVKTETFVNRTMYRKNRCFEVDVVTFVELGKEFTNIYSFYEDDDIIWFSIDGGKTNSVQKNTMEHEVWKFGLKYLGMDYEVRHD